MALVADVAVPAPLARALSYRVPAELAAAVAPGSPVLCELGRRRVTGIVLDVAERQDSAIGRPLKPIVGLLDREPTLPLELLRFLEQLASYYFAPIGEVLRLALPAVGREQLRDLVGQGKLALGEQPAGVGAVVGRQILVARPTDRVEEPGRLRGQTAAVLAALRAEGEQPVCQLERRFGNARNATHRLASLGLVVLESRAERRPSLFVEPPERDEPPTLTPAQSAAVERIEAGLRGSEGPRGLLLFGITGSGKTEVYLRAITTCLAASRGALVLVPEIALTPQLLGRFRARLGDAVALLHSGLAPSDRLEMWRRLRSGQLRVAIGARSALFAPICDLGLVVVDEEHDGSFKQEEGVRYHARDMALLRAHRAGAVSVLGSATPSLEAFALARRGQLELLRLPTRAYAQATLPSVTTVDLRHTAPGPSGHRLLTMPLHLGLEQALARGEQAIVFLNRRGFAPSVVCEGCGKLVTCRQCSVALTFHQRSGGRVHCHYCDFSAPPAKLAGSAAAAERDAPPRPLRTWWIACCLMYR